MADKPRESYIRLDTVRLARRAGPHNERRVRNDGDTRPDSFSQPAHAVIMKMFGERDWVRAVM